MAFLVLIIFQSNKEQRRHCDRVNRFWSLRNWSSGARPSGASSFILMLLLCGVCHSTEERLFTCEFTFDRANESKKNDSFFVNSWSLSLSFVMNRS